MYCPTGIYGRGKGTGWNSQEPVRSSIDLSINKRLALAINKAGLSGKVAHLHRFIFKLRFYAVELLDVIQSPIRFATAFFTCAFLRFHELTTCMCPTCDRLSLRIKEVTML